MPSTEPDIKPPEPPSTIRMAVLADVPSLIRIEERSFLTDRMSPRSFRHLLTRANADCLVAETSGILSGYAAIFYRRGARTARLHSLAVDPGAHRGGIGRALLAAIEATARRHGTETVRLAVRQDNRAAARLYDASGYRETGTEPHYYEDGMAAVTMEKCLAAA